MTTEDFFKKCESLDWNYEQLQNKYEYDQAFQKYTEIKDASKWNMTYSKIFSDWKTHVYSPLKSVKPRLEDYE